MRKLCIGYSSNTCGLILQLQTPGLIQRQTHQRIPGEVITLRVVDWESDEMNAAMQDAFDNVFSVEHPNIKVEIVEGSYSDYNQQMNAMITAGEAPDVFQLGYDQGCSFYKKNLLTDWTDKVAEDTEFMDGFYEGTVDGWQYDGKTYGLPGLVNVYGVFYNKDILADAGLDEPSVDWTWDDLFDYAEKLKDPSANKFGLYGLNTDIFGLTNISVSEGGSPFVDSLTHTTTVTVDDKLKETAEKVAGLIADGTIPGRTYETANQLSAFEAGEMGMLFYGQWEVDSLIRNCPDLNWGYAPIPKGSVKAAESYDTVGWVSPKDLKYPDETWELMKFMSPTNTTRYIRPSARGLNRACMRFIGASGICGGCLDAAAPDGRTSARATSATSIDCVAGFGSSPAFGESAARCSCDSITFPLYLAFRGQRRSTPAIRQRAGRRCRLPNLVRVYTCIATKHRTCPIRWITVDNFGWP